MEWIAQDYVQLGLEYLQGWRLHNFFGHLVPVFDLSHCKEKGFFLIYMEFPVVLFVAIASCPVTGQHRGKSGSILFIPLPSLPNQVFIHMDKNPWAFSSSYWTVLALSPGCYKPDILVP